MRPLKSSFLAGTTYDPAKQALTVSFTAGRTTTYYGVPERVVDELHAAKSAGTYFGKAIRAKYSTKPPRGARR